MIQMPANCQPTCPCNSERSEESLRGVVCLGSATQGYVCHSERSEESRASRALFGFARKPNRISHDQILRFAQNDKVERVRVPVSNMNAGWAAEATV